MDLSPPYDQLVPELKLPEYAGLDDADALARLRGKTESVAFGVRWKDIASWAAGNGARAKIADAAADPNSPVRSIALTCLDSLQGDMAAGLLDTTNPAVVGPGGMLDALVAVGVLTAAQKSELITLGTLTRPLPWAAGLGPGHVASARDLITQGA